MSNILLKRNPNINNQMMSLFPNGDAPIPSQLQAAIMLALGVDVNPQPTGVTYYLDNTHGNASDSNEGLTESTPWLTLSKALTTLTAGDMLIGDGTYTHEDTCRPVNSGTLGNPIIYRAKTPRSFILDQLNSHDGFRLDDSTVVPINYTVFDGMEMKNIKGIQGVDGNSTGGSAAVFTKSNNQSIHILNCYIHDIDCQAGTNAGTVRFDKQSGGVIYNCNLHTVRVDGVASNNAAVIHGYGHDKAIIAFNKLTDANHGIDAKNSLTVNDWKLIANDIDVDVNAIYVNVIGAGNANVAVINMEIYGNLFRRGLVRFECTEHSPQSEGLMFRNNVLLEKGILNYQLKDAQYYDNIFDFDSTNENTAAITTQRRDQSLNGTVCSITYSDHNNYHSGSKFTTNRYAQEGGVAINRMSLSAWQALLIGDGFDTIQVDNPDINSTQLANNFDANFITQNAALLNSGRFGGIVGLEYQAGPDWSIAA